MNRIDVHQHLIPPGYREALRRAGITEVGGRALPDWGVESALEVMDDLSTSNAVLSVSAPGTTFVDDGVRLAQAINDETAEILAPHRDRLGFFATVPLPDVDAAAAEAERALDLGADGVILLANSNGTYLGEDRQDRLWQVLDERSAVAFIHPAELPGPQVPGVAPWAADFLLDTTRAAYLLVRNGIRRDYPNIRFILSHAGGFVPYASHRMAVAITADAGRSPLDNLDDFASFYFDTALSASPATFPSLMAFAQPGHVLFGSDWPFAPATAGQYFAGNLDTDPNLTNPVRQAINRDNALRLFPRFGAAEPLAEPAAVARMRRQMKRSVFRAAARAISKRDL
ncbi:amidohydrolase family protein [Smaragdicoccus niigatensis]|uniref:amidohydrolase family protein n=1 Tax=Smaragdicoccus niigatensis TaxID=359359 RepID=UPI00037C03E6|nr:amidohydrolase family protein [Smaragdicoccus niigatensis]